MTPVPCDTSKGACWQPALDSRWQYQLQGRSGEFESTGGIDVSICSVPFTGGPCVTPSVFDIDLYVDASIAGNNHTVNTAAVDTIHAAGGHAICYIDAGDAESYRPDYQRFVRFDRRCGHCLIGKPFSPRFPDEFWLNLNDNKGQRDFILSVNRDRVRRCASAGFDGVEFDIMDAYAAGSRVTGWNISYRTQLVFDESLANLVHSFGLTVALKNDLGQLSDLMPYFDYAVNEQCFQYHECDDNPPPGYPAWIAAGKAVFQVEYRIDPAKFCAQANAESFNSIKKARNFDLYAQPYTPCR